MNPLSLIASLRWKIQAAQERWKYRNIPSDLAKACCDDCWDYAIGLRSGVVFHFKGASLCNDREWIKLNGVHLLNPMRITVSKDTIRYATDPPPEYEMNFDRGIMVRISEIEWCCDAPWGS